MIHIVLKEPVKQLPLQEMKVRSSTEGLRRKQIFFRGETAEQTGEQRLSERITKRKNAEFCF